MMIRAPAKLNLCLFLGRRRGDGLHRIVSVFEPIGLADEVEIGPAPIDGADTVEFAAADASDDGDGVKSRGGAAELARESTVHAALAEARAAGWNGPPCAVKVTKRIPLGAGLGGGSADAAAVLRWIGSQSPRTLPIAEIAMRVGADVPSQLDPGPCLVGGAGEAVDPVELPDRHALVMLTSGGGLETAAVFAEADRLGLGRSERELDQIEESLRLATGADLLHGFPTNDLARAALSLRPELAGAFDAMEQSGAERVAMTGSGATVFGVFADRDSAEQAAAALKRDDVLLAEAGGRIPGLEGGQ